MQRAFLGDNKKPDTAANLFKSRKRYLMEILDKFNIKHGVGKEEYVNKTQVRA